MLLERKWGRIEIPALNSNPLGLHQKRPKQKKESRLLCCNLLCSQNTVLGEHLETGRELVLTEFLPKGFLVYFLFCFWPNQPICEIRNFNCMKHRSNCWPKNKTNHNQNASIFCFENKVKRRKGRNFLRWNLVTEERWGPKFAQAGVHCKIEKGPFSYDSKLWFIMVKSTFLKGLPAEKITLFKLSATFFEARKSSSTFLETFICFKSLKGVM